MGSSRWLKIRPPETDWTAHLHTDRVGQSQRYTSTKEKSTQEGGNLVRLQCTPLFMRMVSGSFNYAVRFSELVLRLLFEFDNPIILAIKQ